MIAEIDAYYVYLEGFYVAFCIFNEFSFNNMQK